MKPDEKHLKIQIKELSSGSVYSSGLEEGDFVPYFVVNNEQGTLDMQRL